MLLVFSLGSKILVAIGRVFEVMKDVKLETFQSTITPQPLHLFNAKFSSNCSAKLIQQLFSGKKKITLIIKVNLTIFAQS